MTESSRLEVALRHSIGAVTLDLAFVLTQPWTVLFAPSGAGKSTVLRIIAGLTRPEAGRLVWKPNVGQQQVLTDTASGIFVSPHRRAIRFVGQQPALFPHRTVLENITYGISRPSRERDAPRRHAEHVNGVLAMCRIEHLAAKMPATLSGGERQRVAIARAIAATGCRVLLLDEPFSALDTTMREDLVAELKPWLAQRNIPVLQVTHDVGEVFALRAEVLKMHAGRLIAQGPAGQVLREEQVWLGQQLGFAGTGSGI